MIALASLPLHPLVVHLPVVLLPLAALGIAFLTFQPKARRRMAVPLIVVLAVGFAFTLVASRTGEMLAPYVGGEPTQHATLGRWLVWASLLFFIVGGGWLWWVRHDVRIAGKPDRDSRMKLLGGMVSTLIGLGVVALTVTVGHLGARATWMDVVDPPKTPATTASDGVTMLEVSRHSKDDDCWVAIRGEAYDLSEWLPRHPGGPSRIGRVCGTDATAEFSKKHDGQQRPLTTLEQYKLGPVVG